MLFRKGQRRMEEGSRGVRAQRHFAGIDDAAIGQPDEDEVCLLEPFHLRRETQRASGVANLMQALSAQRTEEPVPTCMPGKSVGAHCIMKLRLSDLSSLPSR